MKGKARFLAVCMAFIQLSCKTTTSSTKAITGDDQPRSSISRVNEVDGLLTTLAMRATGRRLCFGLPYHQIQGRYLIWGMDPALDCKQAFNDNRPMYTYVGLDLSLLFQVPIDPKVTIMKVETAKGRRYVGIALVRGYKSDDIMFGSQNAKLMTLCEEPRTDPCDFTFKGTSTGDAAPTFTFNEDADFGGSFFFESVTVRLSKADFDVQTNTVSIPLPDGLQNAALVEGLVGFAAQNTSGLSIGRTSLTIGGKAIGFQNSIAMTAEDYARRYAETGVKTFKTKSQYDNWLASLPVGAPGASLQLRYTSSDYESIFGTSGTPTGEVFLTIFYKKP